MRILHVPLFPRLYIRVTVSRNHTDSGLKSANGHLSDGIRDLRESLGRWRLWLLLGWIEIRQRYARSLLGPFWLTISTGTMILAIGVVFGVLLHQPMQQYLPMLGIGVITWTLISTIINEGATAYISAATYMRQINTPKLLYIFQVTWRNFIIFLHNFAIVILLMAVFGVRQFGAIPLVIPGLILLVLNAMWMAAIVALLSTRYRDVPQIIGSVMLVCFYVTPVMYSRSMLKSHAYLLLYNPFSYLLSDVRRPLLGLYPTPRDWIVPVVMALAGWFFALVLNGRYHRRLAYWL